MKSHAVYAPITFEEIVMVMGSAVISPYVLLIGEKRVTRYGSKLNNSLGETTHVFNENMRVFF